MSKWSTEGISIPSEGTGESVLFHEYVHAAGGGEAEAYHCEYAVYGAEAGIDPDEVINILTSQTYVNLYYSNFFAPEGAEEGDWVWATDPGCAAAKEAVEIEAKKFITAWQQEEQCKKKLQPGEISLEKQLQISTNLAAISKCCYKKCLF
jgi:hypothetical protein